MIGTTIDRYRIVEQLGQGGMGVVYKARDTLLDRFVALKVLLPDTTADPDRRRRFLLEAKSASSLNHPGIVAIYDVVAVDGQDVWVMEWVPGETLESRLAQRRMPLSEALGLGIAIADALARAHTAGIVHRDLKPSNVMVTADGVKILDFGLAKLVEAPFSHPEAPTMAPEEPSLTRERAVLGTVGWMSPEQASGEPVDSRGDVFAFGVLLYEMLTGLHPFRRGTALETIAAIREDEPRRPTEIVPALPPEVERAALRCLRKNPEQRWQSLSDLKNLEDVLDLNLALKLVADRFFEVGFDVRSDNEHHFAETRADGIVDGIVEHDFAGRPDRIDLLEPAVAASNSCGHDHKGWLHVLFSCQSTWLMSGPSSEPKVDSNS